MLHDPLTACSLEVTWQIKNKVSILLRDLWLLNLTGRWRMIRVTHPYCLMILWPCSYVRSRGKLKAQYLLFHKDYDYQAFQGSQLWWSKLSHNVKWLSHNEVTWSHVTNWKRDIFSCTTPVTTKLGRLVTCNAENSRIMSHDPLNT